jgi:putative endonuclease
MKNMHNKNLGKLGEEKAIEYLSKKGYEILETNFSFKTGEIDIITKQDNCIIFVEVKTRNNISRGFPQESVTNFKINQIIRTALIYIKKKSLYDLDFRFDVISVLPDNIEHIINAFDAEGMVESSF